MAAFALGLIGDGSPAPQLTTLLGDADPRVRGRAAEALGLIGAKDAAAAIGRMAAEYGRGPAVAALHGDDEPAPLAAEAEAFRLGLYALVRLRAYEPLAAAALDAGGNPVTTWWPAAYALQRIGDARALPALRQLLGAPGTYTPAFAARGVGVLKDHASVEALIALLDNPRTPLEVRVSAVRAIAQAGDAGSGAALARLLAQPSLDPNLVLEVVTAAGTLKAADALPIIQDSLTDPWPALRIAALRAAAAIDQESFVLVLASLDRDPDWRVRAALGDVLATLSPEVAIPRLRSMLQDEDKRVLPSVVRALVRLHAPEAASLVLTHLTDSDFAVRAAMASLVGELKPAGGADALRQAYHAGRADSAFDARAAALSALTAFGAAEATATLKEALADPSWPIRLQASAQLTRFEPGSDYRLAIRPVPSGPIAAYDSPQLVTPEFSPHVFIETARGTIEFELAVLDAPQTTSNFMALARRGFFNGLPLHRVVPNFVVQDGDPRGDGEGGPGYSIRDELNERPYLRGTVGMALSGPDTGGSQFFITALAATAPRCEVHRVRTGGQGDGGRGPPAAGGHDPAGARVGRKIDAVERSVLRSAVQQERGRRPPPFLAGERLNASCQPSSSRPWPPSLPLRLSPPSFVGFRSRGALTASQRCCHRGTSACALAAPVASLRELPRAAGGLQPKKLGVSSFDTPGPADGR